MMRITVWNEFRPYYNEIVQKIIKNAIKWAMPAYRTDELGSPHAIEFPEGRNV